MITPEVEVTPATFQRDDSELRVEEYDKIDQTESRQERVYSGPTEIPKLADNTINFHAILNGMQTLTTVMIKNIPMRFSQQDLLQMIQERHS